MYDFLDSLYADLQYARTQRDSLKGSDAGRNWAIVVTDLEKVYAYIQMFLYKSEE